MSDRTINFGESETEATYQIQDTDSTGGGNFVVAKDTNANTVLLQYDPTTDTWEYAGDVDMNGGNVSGVGTLTADSVNTEKARIGQVCLFATLSSDQTVQDNTDTLVEFDDAVIEHTGAVSLDASKSAAVIEESGIYSVEASVSTSQLSPGDDIRTTLRVNGSLANGTEDGSSVAQDTFLNAAYVQAFTDSLDAGDELTVNYRQISGGPVEISALRRRTRYIVRRVG